ncbi:MAG: hypothetical protein IIA45_08535 [Bacteroidetes bacterium]|nr:hypothetical protein [Bacteroidota bacterium]
MLKRILFTAILPLLLITILAAQNKNADLNDSHGIYLISNWPSSNIQNLFIKDMAIYDNHIFTIGNYLRALDISTPAIPEQIDSLSIPGNAFKIHIDSNYAYILHKNGLTICDISSTNDLKIVGDYTTNSKPKSVAIYNDFAFLCQEGSKWISLIDISNQNSPASILSFEHSENVGNLKVYKNKLYIHSSDGIYIYDISFPFYPKSIGYINTGKYPMSWDISNNTMGLIRKGTNSSQTYYFFRIYDIAYSSNVTSLYYNEIAGFWGSPFKSYRVRSFRDYIYLSAEGFKIYNIKDSTIQGPILSYSNEFPYFYLTADFIIINEFTKLRIFSQPKILKLNSIIEPESISVHYSNNYIHFKFGSDNNDFKIYDISGRVVFSSRHKLEAKFDGFKGIYIYEVVWGNGERKTGKIMRWR